MEQSRTVFIMPEIIDTHYLNVWYCRSQDLCNTLYKRHMAKAQQKRDKIRVIVNMIDGVL